MSYALILALSVNYVVHISVDGLHANAVMALGPQSAPNFYRLRTEGAFTDNARTDPDWTVTLPNHTSIITGLGVDGDNGHNYTANVVPTKDVTLHGNKGNYLPSIFDVVHDNGGSTALFVSKEKFIIYERSYNAENGARDIYGLDNGKMKIDHYQFVVETRDLVAAYLRAMTHSPINYTLLHLRDPDAAGHKSTWDITSGSDYLNAVAKIDELLGEILSAIETHPDLKNRTAIVLTTDHGGERDTIFHSSKSSNDNFAIPFYAWGPGIVPGGDLYEMNRPSRKDPGANQMDYANGPQPIRNSDSANLVLGLLGHDPIPGSTINANGDLSLERSEEIGYKPKREPSNMVSGEGGLSKIIRLFKRFLSQEYANLFN